MQTDRRAILTLVALGRITPREGERLLLAWNAGRQSLWAPAACLIAACMLLCAKLDLQPLFAALTHIALNHIHPLATHLFGGIL